MSISVPEARHPRNARAGALRGGTGQRGALAEVEELASFNGVAVKELRLVRKP